ncbi:unnamed protein product, partial [Iphiclides podalirius]
MVARVCGQSAAADGSVVTAATVGDVWWWSGRVASAAARRPPLARSLTPPPWRVPDSRRATTHSTRNCRPADQVPLILAPRDTHCARITLQMLLRAVAFGLASTASSPHDLYALVDVLCTRVYRMDLASPCPWKVTGSLCPSPAT